MHLPTILFLCWFAIGSGDPVFYRSSPVPYENLEKQAGRFTITDDKGQTVDVELYFDKQSENIYWYRRLFTEVCLTGECRPIDIGIYWTGEGNYLGIEVFRENLTKTDHSDFSDFDYRKLESVLRDEWSPLREYEFEELVDEKKGSTDATTGATKKVIADASVKDAVYTTYTMWHLIHVGEGEQLSLLTYRYLNEHPGVLAATLGQANAAYLSFLTQGMTSGKLAVTPRLIPVILNGLTHTDATYKTNAFGAIGLLPLDDPWVQDNIAQAYRQWSISEKNRFLQSIGSVEKLQHSLYEALAADLVQENAWFLSSLIPVLAKSAEQSREVVKRIRELARSDQPRLKEAAEGFLSRIGLKP